jgi:hypothetical protein
MACKILNTSLCVLIVARSSLVATADVRTAGYNRIQPAVGENSTRADIATGFCFAGTRKGDDYDQPQPRLPPDGAVQHRAIGGTGPAQRWSPGRCRGLVEISQLAASKSPVFHRTAADFSAGAEASAVLSMSNVIQLVL